MNWWFFFENTNCNDITETVSISQLVNYSFQLITWYR